MKQKRRDFLRISAASALGIVAFGPVACNSAGGKGKNNYGVGIQLYTIRDAMAEDVAGSLQKVADIGYKNLELADYSDGKFYGYTPKEFKKLVNDMGMEVVSSHTQVEAEGITIDNAKKMADDHAELGVEYCVQPWVNDEDRNIETYKKMIADWNEVGRIMKDAGIQFGYHNHNFEFKNING
ncbi:MAG: sugar phosphate isomerase/epimerase family protein, partial [Prolixibacteraceae bacterium]